jgi:HSP20 family protein
MDIDRIKKFVSDVPLRYERKGFEQKTRSFPVDVYETRDAFVIVADLPGVPKDGLMVHIVDHRLQIVGRPAARRNSGAVEYLRVFRLPDGVSSKEVQADLKDGVLTVKLPKPDRMKPIHIPVATDLNFTI